MKKRSLIPKSFQLYGSTIKVRKSKHLQIKTDSYGEAVFQDQDILIQDMSNKELQEQTFYHELTHFILYMMGHPLYSNEEFVEHFSKLLHQFNTTKQGEL